MSFQVFADADAKLVLLLDKHQPLIGLDHRIKAHFLRFVIIWPEKSAGPQKKSQLDLPLSTVELFFGNALAAEPTIIGRTAAAGIVYF